MSFLLQMCASYNDLYPERRGTEVNPNVLQRATGQGHPRSLKTACDRDVVYNVSNMPMVQHMLSALRTAGCEVDLTRHVACDMCMAGKKIEHAGGYDPALNQVSKYVRDLLICEPMYFRYSYVQTTPQMWDLCMELWSGT